MFSRRKITTILLFTVLTVTGVCLIVFGSSSTLPEAQRVLPLIGTGMFGGSLTFFLVEMMRQKG